MLLILFAADTAAVAAVDAEVIDAEAADVVPLMWLE